MQPEFIEPLNVEIMAAILLKDLVRKNDEDIIQVSKLFLLLRIIMIKKECSLSFFPCCHASRLFQDMPKPQNVWKLKVSCKK